MGKAIIVGGGNAGLAAAYELEKAGKDYVLLEASDRLGGRVGTVRLGEYEYATGAGFTEPQWKKTFEYLHEFDMMDRVERIERQVYGFWYKGKVHYLPMGGKGNLGQMLKFRGLPLRTIPQLLKLAPKFLSYAKGIDENHDFSTLSEISMMSTAEFGNEYGGPEVVDRILTPFLGTMVLTNAHEVSIAHPIALMSLMKGMCSIKGGGISTINDELIKRVGHNCKLNTPVTKVVIENGKATGVETAKGFMPADQVILAVDAETALQIAPDLPAEMSEPLATCKYSSSWNYIIGLEKGVTPEDFLAVFIPGSENSILTTIFDENGVLKNNPKGSSVLHAFTAGWHDDELMALSEEERDRAVIREVQKFFPAVPDNPTFVRKIRYDKAVNLEKPGQFVAIQDLINNHFNDVEGLHLAGEYLFLIACTEGAWSTGADAGAAVADLL